MGAGEDDWLANELDGSALPDQRLARRLQQIAARMSAAPGKPVPAACLDWAATKAAYRFFDNDRVTEQGVLAGHFAATKSRFDASDGPVLVLQDTTEFIYKRNKPEKIGFTKAINSGRDSQGRLREHTLCGLLMHSSLAVTTAGVPLGLAAVKFWTRSKFKGTAALKRKVNPTRVPIETKESYRWLENLRQSNELLGAPRRCVHVGDRESDIYELYCLAQDLGTSFLVRVQTNRLAAPEEDAPDGAQVCRVYKRLAAIPWAGRHTIQLGGEMGAHETATLAVKFAMIETRPPIGKQKAYRPQKLVYIHALEEAEPEGRPKIDWRLVTNLPVQTLADAVEKLSWYALRWKIEVFHKVMKSGCKAEDARLRTAERLVKLLAVIAVVSWRIFWITMSSRAIPDGAPTLALTPTEIAIAGGRRADFGKANYEMTLWRPALFRAFPHAKISRKSVHAPLDYLRTFRNRIAHHEPIIDRHLAKDYASILQVAGWISPQTQTWISHHSRVSALLAQSSDDPHLMF